MVIIGIDPAMRKNGFAICIFDDINNTIEFQTLSFVDFVIQYEDRDSNYYVFAVENSNLQNVSFDMKGNKAILARKSRNAGMNQAVSQLTCDYLLKKGFEVIQISPKQKGEKWDSIRTKIEFEQNKHREIKNYKGLKSEQDKRDAYKLALLGKFLNKMKKR